MGTVNLLQRAKEAWYDAEKKTWKEGKKYLQVSTDEVYGALGADGFFMETTPINPHSPRMISLSPRYTGSGLILSLWYSRSIIWRFSP
jgi:dTDP-D-glucose 4,6-dehydratase